MSDFVLWVYSDDNDDMTQIVRDIVSYEIIYNKHPWQGTIQLGYQCKHYHIKEGTKIDIRKDKRGIANPMFLLPAVVKSVDGNLLHFEERPEELRL